MDLLQYTPLFKCSAEYVLLTKHNPGSLDTSLCNLHRCDSTVTLHVFCLMNAHVRLAQKPS